MTEERMEQVVDEEPEKLRGGELPSREEPEGKGLLLLALTALGVVFGDIGTSPLYALRECFLGAHPIPPTAPNVLGVLSLIFWSLIIVISVKYISYVMQADNEGEGGILALMALLSPWQKNRSGGRWFILTLGVFGAALLYGDGAITPAISVLSAVEGLTVATTALDSYVVPITVIILALLFLFQRRGTGVVGIVFGPVMVIWFATIAVLGIRGILLEPQVLASIDPIHGVSFFLRNHFHGFLVLGAVFLVVTGGEALYADMGHFTARAVRLAWFALVLPALLINYFGQGALLLSQPNEVTQPFYHLAPGWAVYPLVALSTMAAVIASQAVISGVFSLSRQAAFLGVFPRLRIAHTSAKHIGQIYIPSMNWMLMIATILLVVSFRKSSGLAAAYGVAVSTTMIITTMLAYGVARERWHWSTLAAISATASFLLVDTAFLGANIFRITEGGWIPLVIGGVVFGLMVTWKQGRQIVRDRLKSGMIPLDDFVARISEKPPVRVPGTAIFMSGNSTGTPPMLLHHLKFNQVLHENVIVLSVVIEDVPRVWPADRIEVEHWEQGVTQIQLHYGFMEDPDVPRTLHQAQSRGFDTDLEQVTYYVGHLTLIPSQYMPAMAVWRETLYAFMTRNASQSIAFYRLPADRVVEIGIQVVI